MARLLGPAPSPVARTLRQVDWVVLTLTIAICSLAVLNLNSAGIARGYGDWSGKVRSQLLFMGIGAVAMGVVASINYRVFYRASYAVYALGVGFLLLVALVGDTLNSAERWISFGGEGSKFGFQPSEPMKVALVIIVARVLHDAKDRKARTLLLAGALVLLPAVFVIRQPDLSTGIILVFIGLSMVAVHQLTWRAMLILLLVAVVLFGLGWSFSMEGYQQDRVEAWLDPEAHADGIGYQILQGRWAVGNGGFLGRGVGRGTQNVLGFVPYGDSDYAFAIYAEEWGFLGSTFLIALYTSLVLWAINLASQAEDRFGSVLCTGIAAYLFWHVVLNIGIVLEFFPNSGLPLPFFTHGGSNVVSTMLALGLLMSVSRSRKFR